MKSLMGICVVLWCSVGFAQNRVEYLTPARSVHDLQSRNMQRMAEDIFDAQDRAKAEWIKNLPFREFHYTLKTGNPGKFSGKFIEIAGGKATIIAKDNVVYGILMSRFTSKDQEWMREQVRIRKGLKPKPEPKVVASKPAAVPVKPILPTKKP